LLSLFLWQDANLDLLNYHLYNLFALLNGKVALNLGAAEMQSYFNPTLEIPYFLMPRYWPAPLTGLVMGWLHGLNFILLVFIAHRILPGMAVEDHHRVPVLLGISACLSAGFLSELGNTMGDNMTALFILASLFIVLGNEDQNGSRRLYRALSCLLSGLVMGIATGLKLTNAIYAAALCVALLFDVGSPATRFQQAFSFGIGVIAGISVSAGYCFLKLWHVFGNPLFPQFNNIFNSPWQRRLG
jgi:hypothetical protein